MSAALAGRFLTPGPPVKSLPCSFGLFTLEGASCHVRDLPSWNHQVVRSPTYPHGGREMSDQPPAFPAIPVQVPDMVIKEPS